MLETVAPSRFVMHSLLSVNVLRKNGCPLQVRYAVTYLKPPLAMLLVVARIRGLDNITDREIETGVKMHLQYLDFVISGENLDAAHRRWEDMVRSFNGRLLHFRV